MRHARQLTEAGIEAVAVCLINSYRNPVHEQRIEAILRERFQHLLVSASWAVLPERKEYERTSTTVVNAYVYLARNGGRHVRHTRGWLHRISVNTMTGYLAELSDTEPPASTPLQALIEGEAQLGDNAEVVDDERVREALKALRPRHQELIQLEMVEGLPDEEIQQRMGIAGNGYYRKVKCEAFKALRARISALSTN